MTFSFQNHLDKEIMVNTRDNKIYIGWMRSFDVYTNIVLEGTMERIIVKDKYADIPVGLIVLRGDAISTVSSKQSDEEIGKVLHKVPLEEIIEEYHDEQAKIRHRERVFKKHLEEKGLIYEGQFDESWVV